MRGSTVRSRASGAVPNSRGRGSGASVSSISNAASCVNTRTGGVVSSSRGGNLGGRVLNEASAGVRAGAVGNTISSRGTGIVKSSARGGVGTGVSGRGERSQQITRDIDNMMDMYYDLEQNEGYNNGSGTDNQLLAAQRIRGGGGKGSNKRFTVPDSSSPFCFFPMIINNIPFNCKKNWCKDGPTEASGKIFDASDRNLLCMDVNYFFNPENSNLHNTKGYEVVVGGADHGLITFNTKSMRKMRTLYNKHYGHSEWVTDVKYLTDGRILSAGMDSKLCLWNSGAGPARCIDLLGHTGSISQVAINTSTNSPGCDKIALSSGYDRTIRIWDLSSPGSSNLGILTGHGQPVLMFSWLGNMVVSGDRRGGIIAFDLETTTAIVNTTAVTGAGNGKGIPGAKATSSSSGQIGSICHLLVDDGNISNFGNSNNAVGGEFQQVTAVGDQSGTVSIFDFRSGGAGSGVPVMSSVLHPGGVVSGLKMMPVRSNNGNKDNGINTVSTPPPSGGYYPLLITCGADRRINVVDIRMFEKPTMTFTDHQDFIYSMEVAGSLVFSGAGNGWLLVHDVCNKNSKCSYGLGANEAAVRCIAPLVPNQLVAAGDDGKVAVYDYI